VLNKIVARFVQVIAWCLPITCHRCPFGADKKSVLGIAVTSKRSRPVAFEAEDMYLGLGKETFDKLLQRRSKRSKKVKQINE